MTSGFPDRINGSTWSRIPASSKASSRGSRRRLQGRGSIIVCDAPQTDSSFATLRKYCGLDEMIGAMPREIARD